MKNYRLLLPLVMIVLMLASWYVLISDAGKAENEYNTYLSEARKYAEDGITKYAIQNYTLALDIKSSVDVYAEVSDYYKSQKKKSENIAWCEDFLEVYPTEPKAYDCMLNAYLEDKDYEACYDIIEIAGKRNISTEYITSVGEQIKYYYRFDFGSYDDVGIYSNNYCAVKNKESWGFVDRYGNVRVPYRYSETGAFTKTNLVSVVNSEGNAYFIDKQGSKVKVSKEEYKSFGLIVEDKVAALRPDGKYTYLNSALEALFGEYDYAATFNGGIAAVKVGDKWQLIDAEGNNVTGKNYTDIKLDEKYIAYRNDRLFVSTGSGYIMINGSGEQVGTLKFDDAKVFASSDPTAVCIDGKWCFVNSEGALVSDKKYDNANSFNNGLAAVCVKGKWGFVDAEENLVIEPKFDDAKSFNEKGSCFVKDGKKWKLLKLYRLNRE